MSSRKHLLNDKQYGEALESLIKKARTDFLTFVMLFNPPGASNYKLGNLQRYLISLVQKVVDGEISKNQCISCPPQHTKSTHLSVEAPSWILGRMAGTSIALAGYNHMLTIGFSKKIKDRVMHPLYRLVFPECNIKENANLAELWECTNGSSVVAASTGSKLTGRRVDWLIIDDPHSGREEAESPSQRAKVLNWYFADCLTRLSKNASQFLIACMTGDTPVTMEDGTSKPLRKIKVGDRVATYDDGQLSTSTILNWVSQGTDKVFEITMSCGSKVKANERHPFLVYNNGKLQWAKLKYLKTGERLLKVRQNGERGRESYVPIANAISQQNAGGCVCSTTAKNAGKQDTDPPLSSARKQDVPCICGIDTGWSCTSMKQCISSNVVDVLCVESCQTAKTPEHIGQVNCASITTTIQNGCVGCCATTATLLSDTENHPKCCCEQQSISDFTTSQIVSILPAGEEEVFDVEVEGTENFIANGLVSHNTRWHPDDLIGSLTKPEYVKQVLESGGASKIFEVTNLKALSDGDDDPLGRGFEEPLFPEERPKEMLMALRATLPSYEWASQYQGVPKTASSDQVDTTTIPVIDAELLPENLRIVRGWDLAITEKQSSDFTVGAKIGWDKKTKTLYIIDVFRKRMAWTKLRSEMIDISLRDTQHPIHPCTESAIEAVGGFEAIYQDVRESMMGKVKVVKILPGKVSKLTNAQPWLTLTEFGRVILVRGPWNRAFLDELAYFPVGKYDDQVDAVTTAYKRVSKENKLLLA